MSGRGKTALVIDAEWRGSAVTRANTLWLDSNAHIRVRLVSNSRVGAATLARATKMIRKNEEIFIDYGSDYPEHVFKC